MPSTNHLSVSEGVFTLCKSILGASLIFLPSMIAALGILPGAASIIILMVVNIKSLEFITAAAKQTQSTDLIELGEDVASKKGKYIVTLLLFFTCIIPMIIYIGQTTNFYSDFLVNMKINLSKEILRLATSFLAAVFCVVFRRVDKLKSVNIFGLLFLSLFTLYIVYNFIDSYKSIKFKDLKYQNYSVESFKPLSNICFAYCCQFSILPIMNSMKSKGERLMVIRTSNVIAAVIYLITGILGYIINPHANRDFFVKGNTNSFVQFLRVSLGTVNILTFPLLMIPTRTSLHFFAVQVASYKSSCLSESLEAVGLVILCYAVSFLTRNNSDILGCMFFFSGSFVMFGLPSYFYAKVFKKKLCISDRIFIFINAVLVCFCLAMGLKSFIDLF